MTALYFRRAGSRNISWRSIPSVRNFILVLGEWDLSNRTAYPTLLAGDADPRGVPISSATLLAKDMAATLRGCVIAMQFLHQGSVMRNCGTWVLLPLPVSPARISTSRGPLRELLIK